MAEHTSLRGKLRSAAMSDTGRIRDHNEDAVAWDTDIGLFVLADGMGGYNAGEVASGIAVKTIMNLVREAYANQDLDGIDERTGLSRPAIVLRDAVARANKIIHQTSHTESQCEGMGTTVVACLLYDNRLVTAHVGDSRLYRMHQGKLKQVTLDHSLLQELVDRGFYTPEEAAKVANKNYVTRALGVEPLVDVEVREHPVSRGDCLLLCSDGLTDMVEDKQIELTLTTFGNSLETAARQLVQMANDNGGRDNVSVVLAEVAAPFPVKKGILDRILGWFG